MSAEITSASIAKTLALVYFALVAQDYREGAERLSPPAALVEAATQ